MRRLILLILLFLIAVPSLAATRSEPAYRIAKLEAGYPWSEGFSLSFAPDEGECRRKYGNRWQQKCAAPLGIPGQVAKGLKLTPNAAGHWVWQDAYSIKFLPRDGRSIRPATLYAVDLSGLYIPAYVKLNKNQAQAYTLPLSARLNEARFWIDPAPEGKHRLAMAFAFNFPVPENVFNLSLALPSGSKGGKPEIVWNQARDNVSVSWPITKLPDASGDASVLLAGMGQMWRSSSEGWRFVDSASGGARFSQTLPGREQIFRIEKVGIGRQSSDNLDMKHILEIETSLYTSSREVEDNLIVIELPEFKSKESAQPYNWSAAEQIPKEAISAGRYLKPVALQANDAKQSRFRYELPAQGGRHLFIILNKNIKSATGIHLVDDWAGVVKARPFDGQIGFLQPGHILPEQSEIDIFGVGLDSIAWEANFALPPFLALLAQTSSNPFEFPLEDINLGIEAIASAQRGEITLPKKDEGKAQYASLDLGKIYDGSGGKPSGIILLKLKGLRAGKEVANAQRLILATDLGIMVKRSASGALNCFAYSLGSGKPAAGAKIIILGANGKPVIEASADSGGHAVFPSLSGLKRESSPVVAIAEHDGALAWMPLNDRNRELNYSSFDTGGSHVDANGILAYVFSQRGLYRPGDSLYFGCIPRRADFSPLPADVPLFAEITNPAGRKIWQTDFKAGEKGIAELVWPSLPESLSGKYVLNIRNSRYGEIIGSCAVRLEAFQPDTMKLKLEPPAYKGWLVADGSAPTAKISLQNLYGSPACDRRLNVEVVTAPALFSFDRYPDYKFFDPAPFLGSGSRRVLGEARTDHKGHASFGIPPDLLGASARVSLLAEGFDVTGGRATTGAASFLCSPMRQILGYKLLGALTNPDFIKQGSQADLEFLAINSDLDPTPWKNLKFSILRRNYITNLVSDGAGGFHYDETNQEIPLRTWRADLPQGTTRINLDTAVPGEYLLLAIAEDGRILGRLAYNVIGERLASGGDLAASKMRMRLNKERFDSGDEILVSYSLPYDAIGLATIERGDVETYKWLEAHAGDNTAKIRIPDNFAGKGFVTLTFMRKTDSPSIYMTPLSYAVAPFTAVMARHDLGLKLETPASAPPGTDLAIRISAKKPGRAIIYAVDEGILQLTPWRDPDPLADLLGERALDVATLQTADLLMPPHARLLPRLSAFGGGTETSPFGAKFQNPFKRRNEPPLVYWSGLVDVGVEPVELNMRLPAWQAGKLRIFAVGASGEGAGAAVANLTVAGSLVLTPQAPNAVAPGDEFEGALILANTSHKSMAINLNLTPSVALKLLENLPQSVTLAAGGEIALPFRALALDSPGGAGLMFTASAPNYELKRDLRLSIRPACAMRSTLVTGVAHGSCDLAPAREVYPQLAQSVASVSGLPLPLGQALAKYLDTYPYGCTEQLLSRALSLAMLSKWPGLNQHTESHTRLLDATLAAVASRYNGRFVGLWPDGEGDLLLTAYAADCLLGLREAGLGNTADLLSNICDSLGWNLALNEPSIETARVCAYAIWVLAREGRVVTQQLETLLRTLEESELYGWEDDITGALIIAIKRELAIPVDINPEQISFSEGGWFDELAQRGLVMTILNRYFPRKVTDQFRQDFYDFTISALNDGNYSTFSAAQGLRGLVSCINSAAPILQNASLRCVDPAVETTMVLNPDSAILNASAPQCSQYRLEMPDNEQPLFWQVATIGYDRSPEKLARAQGIEIKRQYLDKGGKPCVDFRQGDEIRCRIVARSEIGELKDCVISDLLPGCLEMIIPRNPEKLPSVIKAIDRQEDRLLIFADLSDSPLEIEYSARVVSPGKFVVPAVTAQAMYDQATYGNDISSNINVARLE